MMAVLLLVANADALLLPTAANAVATGRVHREPNFLPPNLVEALREDLRQGQFTRAESYSSNGARDELRSALTCRVNVNTDAFDALHERLDVARHELSLGLGVNLASGFEATYVVYPPGGYYKRHVDAIDGVDEHGSGRRACSFIAYLSQPASPWTPHDGGALRCYNRGADVEEDHVDVLPESGLLVLFDSKKLWHEVRPTQRERACLVGWFRTE